MVTSEMVSFPLRPLKNTIQGVSDNYYYGIFS